MTSSTIIKWTTPTLTCKIPEGLVFDYIIFTLSQNEKTVERRIDKSEVVDNKFNVFITQEETGQFSKNFLVKAQLNILLGENRQGTNTLTLKITENLHDKVIGDTNG